MWPSAVSVNRWSSEIQATARSKCPAVVAQSRHAFVGGTKWSPWRRRTDIFFIFFLKQQKRHQKCRFVGSTQLWWFPSFVKASVLCPLPNQRERLKHTFVGSKPAEDQCQQNYLSFFSFFFYHSKRSELRTRKERVSQSSDHYQAMWDAQLLFVCSCCCCVCVCVCVCEGASCTFSLWGWNNKFIRKSSVISTEAVGNSSGILNATLGNTFHKSEFYYYL